VGAVAACLAIMLGPWRGPDNGSAGPVIAKTDGANGAAANNATIPVTIPSAADLVLAQLRAAMPADNEAVVLRLRVPAGQPVSEVLDAALSQVGLTQRSAAQLSAGAMQVGSAYRNQLAAKFGPAQPGTPNTALDEATIAAADALFVEASWDKLEKAIASLAQQPKSTVDLSPVFRMAMQTAANNNGPPAVGEGEGQSGSLQQGAADLATEYVQRLNAGMFRLEKAVQDASTALSGATPPASVDGKRRVRLLILVETVQP
jgi:hypothetical protein